MKYIPSLFLVFLLTFTSCDGKHRVHHTEEEKLKKSNLSKSFFEQIKHIPEQYTEVVTDTITNDGYHIRLKIYSDMDTSVLKETKKGPIKHKHYFRVFNGDLTITLNNSKIINKKINKSLLANNINDNFWKHAVLGNATFNQALSNSKEIFVNAFYRIPETNQYKDYNIIIDLTGNLRIEELSANVL